MASILIHAGAILLLVFLPDGIFFSTPPLPEIEPERSIVTPLVEPLTALTQKAPNRGKIARAIDVAALVPQTPRPAPVGQPAVTRPVPPRPIAVPTPPRPIPSALPDPPKIEAPIKEAPKLELPDVKSAVAPPVPVERPKLALENVGGPPPPVPPDQRKVAIPSASITDAIRQNLHGGGSGAVGVNVPPSLGAQGSGLELKSDPMGADFPRYIIQLTPTIQRHWDAVMPQSVKQGLRGKVGVVFDIAKNGRLIKASFAFQSGIWALDQAALTAITSASPFPPLPADFKGDHAVFQLNFEYNAPRH